MAGRIYLEFSDQAGGFLRQGNWVDAALSDLAYETAVVALTNANLMSSTTGFASTGFPAATSSQYSLTTTTAVMTFNTAVGSSIQVTIPAPVAGIFGGDGVTVDITNPLVIAFVESALGFLTDVFGNPASLFVGGVKSSRKVEQSG
jgi:hypothetical protein